MKKIKFLANALMIGTFTIGGTLQAQSAKEKTIMVGGAEMYTGKNIVENAVNSKDHTTLTAAMQAADLVSVLQSEGPFTVFAPTNAAFEK